MSARHFALLLILLGSLAAWPSAASAATCADFPNQAAAQAAGNTVDADHDGIYCEALPCPCSTAPPTRAPVTAPTPAPPTPTPTPTPAPVAPPADSDGDGVDDPADACPTVPGDGNPNGCPVVVTKPARTIHARVISVADGDTIKVRTVTGKRITVRLIGIDAPETVDPDKPVECGGKQADAAMRKLVLDRHGSGRAVTLTTDPTQDERDRYGRLLAYVKTSDGVNVGRKLIAQGWATTYIYDNVPFQQVTAFQSAEADAEWGNRGVYRSCDGNFHRAR